MNSNFKLILKKKKEKESKDFFTKIPQNNIQKLGFSYKDCKFSSINITLYTFIIHYTIPSCIQRLKILKI